MHKKIPLSGPKFHADYKGMRTLNSPEAVQVLPEGRLCGDVDHFLCVLVGQRNAIALVSHSHTNHTWILSLASYWKLVTIPTSRTGVYSLMNVS